MCDFMMALTGTLYGVIEWPQWDALLQTMRASRHEGWYVYFVGEAVPDTKLFGNAFERMVAEIDALLRRDHDEAYLGIVYVDDFAAPSLIKIYDPNNLGSSCGSCGHVVPPGWVISKIPPTEIYQPNMIPHGRKRWWGALIAWLKGQSAP